MISNQRQLPSGFEELEPFVADWALSENMARYMKRVHSTMEELQEFYDAVEPCAEQALKHLDSQPIGEIDGPEASLMYLMLTLIDVSLAIEVYRAPALPLSPAPERYEVVMERMHFN